MSKNRRKKSPHLNLDNSLEVMCLNCGRLMICDLYNGYEVYGRRDLKNKNFWRCRVCHHFVGVHPHTLNPLGSIPTPEIKVGRRYVHALIDPLWREGWIKRSQLYKRLSAAVGHDFHCGTSDNIEDLRTAYREGLRIKNELGLLPKKVVVKKVVKPTAIF